MYLDVDSDSQTLIEQHCSAVELEQYFNSQCAIFLHWAEQQVQRVALRDGGLQALGFPYGQMRRGQRDLPRLCTRR
ncbi:hypothetical protein D3C81_2169610 [compost metagenome]